MVDTSNEWILQRTEISRIIDNNMPCELGAELFDMQLKMPVKA